MDRTLFLMARGGGRGDPGRSPDRTAARRGPASGPGHLEGLLDSLRQRFAERQVPSDVVYVDEIPKTATGKLDGRESRARVVGPSGGDGGKDKDERLRRLRWVR